MLSPEVIGGCTALFEAEQVFSEFVGVVALLDYLCDEELLFAFEL